MCPNDKFWATSKPKLLGASQHPDEGVCQFGSLILAMSQSSDTLLDHIADYLRFISNAKLFWCLLNTSYNYGRHLASQFHLDPEDYEVVSPLVAPPSRRLVVPAGCLNASCCPLIVPTSRRLVAPAGCHIASCHPLVVPPSCPLVAPASCHIASPRLLVALPTRPLIAPTGCCVAS